MIHERRLLGGWPLVGFIAGGVLAAGCSGTEDSEPEQVTITPEPKPPIAPEVAPPIEHQDAERAARAEEERAHEATRGAAPAEELGRQHEGRAQRSTPEQDVGRPPDEGFARPGTLGEDVGIDRGDLDLAGSEGPLGFSSWTGAGALPGRAFHGGLGLTDGAQIRVDTEDVVSRPLRQAGSQPSYGVPTYMGTQDPLRRNQGVRMDSGDTPSYLTMPPINPDVSEDTVLPRGPELDFP